MSENMKSNDDTQKTIQNLSDDDTTPYIPTCSSEEEERFGEYIAPVRRSLDNHDRRMFSISVRAARAFYEKDKERFAEIILKTKSLYVRDDAVRVAIAAGWMDVAKRLLIRKTTKSYRCPVWTSPLTSIFLDLIGERDSRVVEGRVLLQTVVLNAAKKDNVKVFEFLAPVIGVDYTSRYGDGILDIVIFGHTNLSDVRKWIDLVMEYVDENTSQYFLLRTLKHCVSFERIKYLPYLMDCIFSKTKEASPRIMERLFLCIRDSRLETARCILSGLRKASIPIEMKVMHKAVEIKDIDIILHLYCSGCHSFPLSSYGEDNAKKLRKLLKKHSHENIYALIVLE